MNYESLHRTLNNLRVQVKVQVVTFEYFWPLILAGIQLLHQLDPPFVPHKKLLCWPVLQVIGPWLQGQLSMSTVMHHVMMKMLLNATDHCFWFTGGYVVALRVTTKSVDHRSRQKMGPKLDRLRWIVNAELLVLESKNVTFWGFEVFWNSSLSVGSGLRVWMFFYVLYNS